MFAQVDYPAFDHITSDSEPSFRFYEDDGVQGVSIGIGDAVVTIEPISELAMKLIEITRPE